MNSGVVQCGSNVSFVVFSDEALFCVHGVKSINRTIVILLLTYREHGRKSGGGIKVMSGMGYGAHELWGLCSSMATWMMNDTWMSLYCWILKTIFLRFPARWCTPAPISVMLNRSVRDNRVNLWSVWFLVVGSSGRHSVSWKKNQRPTPHPGINPECPSRRWIPSPDR